ASMANVRIAGLSGDGVWRRDRCRLKRHGSGGRLLQPRVRRNAWQVVASAMLRRLLEPPTAASLSETHRETLANLSITGPFKRLLGSTSRGNRPVRRPIHPTR